MQTNFSVNSKNTSPAFTAITADRVGRALLVQRMKQVRNPVEDWEELATLITKHKDNPCDIFITGGNGDGGIGIVVTNRHNGLSARLAEGPLKIDTPLDLVKQAISISEKLNENMRPMLGLSERVREILNML